ASSDYSRHLRIVLVRTEVAVLCNLVHNVPAATHAFLQLAGRIELRADTRTHNRDRGLYRHVWDFLGPPLQLPQRRWLGSFCLRRVRYRCLWNKAEDQNCRKGQAAEAGSKVWLPIGHNVPQFNENGPCAFDGVI